MSEADEQAALIRWAQLYENVYPELALLYHIPNGGWRHKVTAMKLKGQGAKAGVPDLHLPVARGGYHGLWIEMKYGRNKLTESQVWWHVHLRLEGHAIWLCHSAEEAQNVILDYLAHD